MAASIGLLLILIVSMTTGARVSEDVKRLAAATADLGLDLYRKISETSDSPNMFLSPYSIATALTLAYQGAEGNTMKQMSDVLRYSRWSTARINSDYRSMNEAIFEDEKEYLIHIANRLFGQTETTFLDSFLRPLNQYYKAPLEQKDFVRQPEEARKDINNWVANLTMQKIKDLLPPGSIDSTTELVLANAIYFKGNWAEQFDKNDTQEELFHTSSSSSVKVPMMQMSGNSFKISHDRNLKAKIIRLPYDGDGEYEGPEEADDIAMYIILPDEIDGLTALEGNLTADMIDSMIDGMYTMEVTPLKIPKFDISGEVRLKEPLKALGIKEAFGRDADFSGMTGEKNLYISDGYHKAVIEVDEEGTTAAAATGVVISVLSMPLTDSFVADRPFIFFIREDDTGSLLFLGSYKNPQAGNTAEDSSAPRAMMNWFLLVLIFAHMTRFL